MMRPTTAIVRLNDIAANYQLAARLAPASRSIPVIKANAYGHGILAVARCLEPMAPALAVAFIDEAVRLRDAGIRKPILVLQGVSRAADLEEAATRGFWVLLHSNQQADWTLSARLPDSVRVWVKVDTGMHRLGFQPHELDKLCDKMCSSQNIKQGPVLCTHLACADDPADPLTLQQVQAIRVCAEKHHLDMSIANSAGILFWPQSHAQWNRPGYMLYGHCPGGSFDVGAHGLKPAMTMNSEIIAIREIAEGESVGYGRAWVAKRPSKIGTVAIGYGDGYPRHAPNGTPVLVNGVRVPLVGRVSMDAICVDLTGVEEVHICDKVELWGQNLSVNEVAASAGTIGYELLAGLTGRVPLQYTD